MTRSLMLFPRSRALLSRFGAVVLTIFVSGVLFAQGSGLVEQKVNSDDQASRDGFGAAVDIDGDWAVIGALNASVTPPGGPIVANAGAVYIFKLEGSSWIQQAKLIASNPQTEAKFGFSVAIDGQNVAVGAVEEDVSGMSNAGAAYVFSRDGQTWSEDARLISQNPETDGSYGESIALNDGQLLVGAHQEDAGGTMDSGMVYFYLEVRPQLWDIAAVLFGPARQVNDSYGISVALDGSTAVIGSWQDDDLGSDSGSAFVYRRDGIGFAFDQQLNGADSDAEDFFGGSVAIDEDTIIVGADMLGETMPGPGAAYVFVRPQDGAFTQQAKFTASSPVVGESFGLSVDLEGDRALVGVLNHDAVAANQGAAYLFTRTGTTWNAGEMLTASDPAANDLFGNAVSMDDTTLLIGAFEKNDPAIDSGAAYFFLPPPPNAALGWLAFE